MIVTNDRDIIHPHERFVALPLWKDSNLRDLTAQTGNVRKRPFLSAVHTNGVLSLWIPSMFVRPALPSRSSAIAALRQLGLA